MCIYIYCVPSLICSFLETSMLCYWISKFVKFVCDYHILLFFFLTLQEGNLCSSHFSSLWQVGSRLSLTTPHSLWGASVWEGASGQSEHLLGSLWDDLEGLFQVGSAMWYAWRVFGEAAGNMMGFHFFHPRYKKHLWHYILLSWIVVFLLAAPVSCCHTASAFSSMLALLCLPMSLQSFIFCFHRHPWDLLFKVQYIHNSFSFYFKHKSFVTNYFNKM